MKNGRAALTWAFAAVLVNSGCARIKPPAPADSPAPVAEAKAAAPAEPTPQPGIKVRSVSEVRVRTGDLDGVSIDGHVDAVHLCTGEKVLECVLGTPRLGVVKFYGHGQATAGGGTTRYHPPSYACSDDIRVELRASDGCKAEATLPIRVSGPTPTAPVRPTSRRAPREAQRPRLTLTAPADGSSQSGPLCPVAGKATGLEGRSLEVVVVPHSTQVAWVHERPLQISDGEFQGVAHLGDELGGAGERFRIEVRLPGGARLAQATVLRTE